MVSDLTAVRRRGGLLAAALVLAGSAGPAAPATATATPAASGDPHGVVLARTVSAAFTKVPVVAYQQSGFAWMVSERGEHPAFRWRWGGGAVAGMVPVRERAVMGLRGGLVRWWRDSLTPLPCPQAALCGTLDSAAQVPAMIVVLPSGTYYAYGDEHRHSCFGRLGGSTPQRIGEPTWSAFGEFQRPAGHGSLELLKSSYPWSLTGGTANEAASLSLRTHLPVRQQTTIVPPAGAAAEPFTFSASYGYPVHGRAPRVNECAS